MMKSSSTNNNNIIKYNKRSEKKERMREGHSWPSEPKMYFRVFYLQLVVPIKYSNDGCFYAVAVYAPPTSEQLAGKHHYDPLYILWYRIIEVMISAACKHKLLLLLL